MKTKLMSIILAFVFSVSGVTSVNADRSVVTNPVFEEEFIQEENIQENTQEENNQEEIIHEQIIQEDTELIITNPKEFNSSIPFTYFFLSKMATRVREIFLPTDSMDIWKKCDILITADPKLIENTPKDKVCIKIKTPYNEKINNVNGMDFDSLSSFISDKNNLTKAVSLYNGRK